MPPANKDMSSEGGSQTELFQWGSTSMAEWRQHGYDTSNARYNGGFPMDRKGRHSTQEETPWSTTNGSYGKGVLRRHSEQDGSLYGSYQSSVLSYRSHPGTFKRDQFGLNGDKSAIRAAIEARILRNSADKDTKTPSLSLPPLDPSKYLVAQGPGLSSHWHKPKPDILPEDKLRKGSGTESVPRSSQKSHPSPAPSKSPSQLPPKTGAARRYMRDSLDRFLRSIPEELRPKTRKPVQPREGPQVLKIEHQDKSLPERRTAMSHAVPSSAGSSSSSSSASDDGVIDLNQSTYDLQKEYDTNEDAVNGNE